MADNIKTKGSIGQYVRKQGKKPGNVKKVPAVRQKTYVLLLLDTSGSMGYIKKQAINHFNETVKTLQEKARDTNQDVLVSLVLFGLHQPNTIRTDQWLAPVDVVVPLTDQTYNPTGGTPMYQAMGETAQRLLETATDLRDPNVAVLMSVITDGQENASEGRYARQTELKKLITELQKRGNWTFTIQGANVDINGLVDQLGVERGNVAAFQSTAAGTAQATVTHRLSAATYMDDRSRGTLSSAGFYKSKSSK